MTEFHEIWNGLNYWEDTSLLPLPNFREAIRTRKNFQNANNGEGFLCWNSTEGEEIEKKMVRYSATDALATPCTEGSVAINGTSKVHRKASSGSSCQTCPPPRCHCGVLKGSHHHHHQPTAGVAAVACKACRGGREAFHSQGTIVGHHLRQSSSSLATLSSSTASSSSSTTTSTTSSTSGTSAAYERLLQQPWTGVAAPPQFHTPAVPFSRAHQHGSVGHGHHYSRNSASRAQGEQTGLEGASVAATPPVMTSTVQLRRSASSWAGAGAAKRSRVSAANSSADVVTTSSVCVASSSTVTRGSDQWSSSNSFMQTSIAAAPSLTPANILPPIMNGGWLPSANHQDCRDKDCSSICKTCCSSSSAAISMNNNNVSADNNNLVIPSNTSAMISEDNQVADMTCIPQQQLHPYQTSIQEQHQPQIQTEQEQEESQQQLANTSLSQQQQWNTHYGVSNCRGASEDGSRIHWNNENSLRLFQV
ncbi:streptococcal hemagglutinin-like [Hetaerina americana]|uniref:streptococcal hemagglutinin-like n=1 Tax=Hetaerina americana TaxID=62018 RepID=UPI003A7F4DBA